jgi:2-isopropylmalate synthase
MTPQSVGVPTNRLVLGKHSGRHALQRRCEELGHPLDAAQVQELYRRFTELADKKKVVLDEDLIRLLHHMEQQLPTSV